MIIYLPSSLPEITRRSSRARSTSRRPIDLFSPPATRSSWAAPRLRPRRAPRGASRTLNREAQVPDRPGVRAIGFRVGCAGVGRGCPSAGWCGARWPGRSGSHHEAEADHRQKAGEHVGTIKRVLVLEDEPAGTRGHAEHLSAAIGVGQKLVRSAKVNGRPYDLAPKSGTPPLISLASLTHDERNSTNVS